MNNLHLHKCNHCNHDFTLCLFYAPQKKEKKKDMLITMHVKAKIKHVNVSHHQSAAKHTLFTSV